MTLSRNDWRAIRFIQEQFPELYNEIFAGSVDMASAAAICREVGKAIVLATAQRDV
jgi:hypothetical protein